MVHNNFYDYSQTNYVGYNILINIICPVHGLFKQRPYHHLTGRGCVNCSRDKVSYDLKTFLNKANIIHKNKYTYDISTYKNLHSKIKIVCPKHGTFLQNANNHFNGSGCPFCNVNNISKKETLWLNSLNVPLSDRNKVIFIDNVRYNLDAYDSTTKTIYEFYGDYWYGNNNIFNSNEINKRSDISFGELYRRTINRENILKLSGYKIVTIWESDYDKQMMNNITKLRQLTSAPIMACKHALSETDNDLEKAIDFLKAKNQTITTHNDPSEGIVICAFLNKFNVMVEINSNTDFILKTKEFTEFSDVVVNRILSDAENGLPFKVESVEEKRQELISKVKENVVIRRWWIEEAMHPCARVYSYTHANNKLASLITVLAPSEDVADSKEFGELCYNLAMQVVAMNPVAVSPDSINAVELDRQKAIFSTQFADKPQAAWAKIMDGKVNKWFSEVCLTEQDSIIVEKTKIKKLLADLGAQVITFHRCQVGEGIETKSSDFADEVAKLAGVNDES